MPFLIQSVNTLVFYKLRQNKHTDILFEGLRESLKVDRLGRQWAEELWSPQDSQEEMRRTQPLLLFSCFAPHLGRSMCGCCRCVTLLKHRCLPPLIPYTGRCVGKPVLEVRFPWEGYSSLRRWSFLLSKQKYLNASGICYCSPNNTSQSWSVPGSTDVFLLQHHWM